MTLTAGSELKVPATTSTIAGSLLNLAVGLTDSLAIAFFIDEDGDSQVDLKAQLIDISALVATLDGISKITVQTNTNGTTAMRGDGCRLTDTSALYVYRYRLSGETDFTEVAQVFTISGSTITANTPVTIRTVTSPNSGESWKLVPLTSTKAMWCYWRFNGSNEWELFASVITISGTTPTINAAATVYTSPASPTRDASTDRYHLTNASSSTAVVQHTELDSGGTGWYEIFAYVLSAPSTTVTVGAAASLSSNDANNGSFEDQQWIARLGDNKAGSYTIDATSGTEAYQVLTITGTSISVGTASSPTQVFEPNSPATGFESDLILAYDRGTSTANDEAVEFSLIGATIPAATDTLAWTPTNRPLKQTPLTGAALPTVITSASSTSAPTGHLYVRLYRSSVTPTPPAAAAVSHIWITTDGSASWTNIGDPAWTTEVIGAVAVVPGTAYQTIYAMVGTNLWRTTNGGTAWANIATIGYESEVLIYLDQAQETYAGAVSGPGVVVVNRATGGDADLIHDLSGTPTVQDISTGKATTGGVTSGGATG